VEPLEIEVKFWIADLPGLRAKVVAAGGVSQGRHFESNLRFDDAAEGLRRSHRLLRLRRERSTVLTLKSKPAVPDERFKVHRELEVRVSDFDTMEQILLGLGFQRRQAYEKWRETFVLGAAQVCLDQMPFGDFLEIEGSREEIPRVAARLGLDWQRRILKNYLELFAVLRERLQLAFTDITFENFKHVGLPPGDALYR